MRTRLVGALVVFAMLVFTGGLIAATGGGGNPGNASTSQYHGKKTCADLVRRDRAAERAMKARHRNQERQFHGKDRARLRRMHQSEEAALHRQHLRAEAQCRRNGGRKAAA